MTLSSAADVGSILLIVHPSTGLFTTNYTKLSTYQHMNPTLQTYFDLDNANRGYKQTSLLYLGNQSATLHIHVYNF